jgi:hypothetical protein
MIIYRVILLEAIKSKMITYQCYTASSDQEQDDYVPVLYCKQRSRTRWLCTSVILLAVMKNKMIMYQCYTASSNKEQDDYVPVLYCKQRSRTRWLHTSVILLAAIKNKMITYQCYTASSDQEQDDALKHSVLHQLIHAHSEHKPFLPELRFSSTPATKTSKKHVE